jgi:CelD/BcsL family acetyltransferase involved in cellulose biosynthesis
MGLYILNKDITIKTIISTEAFAELRNDWNVLLSQSSSDNVFLTWEFCFTWWNAFKENKQLLIILIYDGNGLVGVAPLYRSYTREFGFTKKRQLEFIGGTETFFEGLDFILAPDRETEILTEIFKYLYSEDVPNWDVINLTSYRETSKVLPYLMSILELNNHSNEIYAVRECVALDFPETFQEFLSTLSKGTRKKLKNNKSLLFELGDVHFEYYNSTHCLENAYEEFLEIHQKRQHSKGNEGSFRENRKNYLTFHKNLIKVLEPLEWAFIAFIRVGPKVISGRYNYIYHGTLYAYSLGFDPDWSDYNPGSVLTYTTFEHLLSNTSVRRCDFLRGLGSHKLQWSKKIVRSNDIAVWRSSSAFIKSKIERKLRSTIKLVLPSSMVKQIYTRFLNRANS